MHMYTHMKTYIHTYTRLSCPNANNNPPQNKDVVLLGSVPCHQEDYSLHTPAQHDEWSKEVIQTE